MTKKFILYEHALGYALLRVKSPTVESIAELSRNLVNDDELFCKTFKLHAFAPFGSSAGALQNCNAISEGVVHEDLKAFLKENLPIGKNVFLCVAERKLADALKAGDTDLPENLVCSSESVLLEVFRALRLHFPTYIKELSHFAESKAQIGLGHSYSRAKVKFNINRDDNMIIQSINLLDQLDKDINVFCMRVKEWFSYHFPELIKIVPDSVSYVKVIGIIGTRAGATEDNLEALEQILDSEKAQAIIEASTSSFGFDITEDDSQHLSAFTQRILSLVERRRQFQEYLASKLSGVAPNLSTLIGDRVGARLISHAGSLMNLAKFPASTIQILGAEKALFRALRCRGKTPKYGLIYHSPFITRASRQNKGRISRFLAAKCAIACRVDCFSEIPNDIYGKHLRQHVEARLLSVETGQAAPTNAEAMAAANLEVHKFIRKMKRKAIKILQRKSMDSPEAVEANDQSKPLKKKKKPKLPVEPVTELDHMNGVESSIVCDADVPESPLPSNRKSKKKRLLSESAKHEQDADRKPSKLKRKRSASESSALELDVNSTLAPSPRKKVKKGPNR